MREPTVLLTGFEPFGGSSLNPSALLVERLVAPAGWRMVKRVLPVETETLPRLLSQLFETVQPDLVLSLGEARGSEHFRIERTARNRLSFQLADNCGAQVTEGSVVARGPSRLASTLCPASVAEHLQTAGFPARLSDDAGGFLCNQLFYSCCYNFLSTATRVGFLHLPSLPEQGFGRGVSLELQLQAVQSLLDSLCD